MGRRGEGGGLGEGQEWSDVVGWCVWRGWGVGGWGEGEDGVMWEDGKYGVMREDGVKE